MSAKVNTRRSTLSAKKKEGQKNMYTKFNDYLFGEHEEYYRETVRVPIGCLSFFKMQIIRIIMVLITTVVWAAMFYINVKKCIMYLNFWSLTTTLLYLLYVLPNAGRLEVER